MLVFAASSEASGLYGRLQSRLEEIKTLSGSFVQTTYLKDIGKTQHFEGRFYIKSPDMMKWTYTLNSTDEVYITGDRMIIYQPSEKQAFLSSVKSIGLSASPMRILLGRELSEQDFHIKEKADTILLTPKSDESMIKTIKLFISSRNGLIKRIELTDTNDNQTIIEIKNYRTNPEIQNSLFQFKPPEGTTIIKQ
jgi:outer membrane lipoprotein carrier protein